MANSISIDVDSISLNASGNVTAQQNKAKGKKAMTQSQQAAASKMHIAAL